MVKMKNTNTIKRTADEKIIGIISYIAISLVILICILPFLRVIALAFSADIYIQSGNLSIFPKGFTLRHIRFISDSAHFLRALWISMSSTVVFTLVSIVLTILTAYPLSRSYLPGKRGMTLFLAFTLLFNGGIIPTYLVVKNLGILDTFWALIVPHAISAYNLLILISSFRAIPQEFEEAARVDGASHLTILTKIMIPLNKASCGVILMFYAVFRWNSWFDAMMYTHSQNMRTLQLLVKEVLVTGSGAISKGALNAPSPTSALQSAAVLISVIPVLVLYPLLQKHFVKGIMIGGIKG